MRMVYETATNAQEIDLEHVENSVQLWRYRRTIDLASVREHLSQGSEGKKYELLQLFLRKVQTFHDYHFVIKQKITERSREFFRS